MFTKETVQLFATLFKTGEAVFEGSTVRLENINSDKPVHLVGLEPDKLQRLTQLLSGLIYFQDPALDQRAQSGFEIQAGGTQHLCLSPKIAETLANFFNRTDAQIDAAINDITTAAAGNANAIDYMVFKVTPRSYRRPLTYLQTLARDPRFTADEGPALINQAQHLMTDGITALDELPAARDALPTPLTAIEYQAFMEKLHRASHAAWGLVRMRQRLQHGIDNGAAHAAQYRAFIDEYLTPMIDQPNMKPLFDFTDHTTAVHQEYLKCQHLEAFYAVQQAGLPEAERKAVAKNANILKKLAEPATADAYLKRLVEGHATPKPSQSFIFTQETDGTFSIKPHHLEPGMVPGMLSALYLALQKKMGVVDFTDAMTLFGDVSSGDKISLTAAQAKALIDQYGVMALPAVANTTTVTPLPGGAAGAPPAGAAAGAGALFDLTNADNFRALEAAVAARSLKMDTVNANTYRIYSPTDLPTAGKDIYVKSGMGDNFLQTTSSDPDVYQRMAGLMADLKPTPTRTEGVTDVLISNDGNVIGELAKLAKEMLNQGLGVEVDFSAKPPLPVIDEQLFKNALAAIGSPAMVTDYETKKAARAAAAAAGAPPRPGVVV